MIHATVFRVFVAAPSDVEKERKTVFDLIQEWNQTYSRDGILAESIHWKTHHRPMGGDEHVQKIIDRRLIDGYDCDVLVGIFGTRLGTPTDTHQSGTVEEIEYFSKRKGKANVMLFFGEWDIKRDTDLRELKRLNTFKESVMAWAAISTIEKRNKAKQQIRDGLYKALNELVRTSPRRDYSQTMMELGQRLQRAWRTHENDWNRASKKGEYLQVASMFHAVIAVGESVLKQRPERDSDARWDRLANVVGSMRTVVEDVDEGQLEGKSAIETMTVFVDQFKHSATAFQS